MSQYTEPEQTAQAEQTGQLEHKPTSFPDYGASATPDPDEDSLYPAAPADEHDEAHTVEPDLAVAEPDETVAAGDEEPDPEVDAAEPEPEPGAAAEPEAEAAAETPDSPAVPAEPDMPEPALAAVVPVTEEPAATSEPAAGEPAVAADLDRPDLDRRWQVVQASFVDEPRTAVEDADTLVGETVDQLHEVLATRRSRLAAAWSSDAGGEPASTENLRLALRDYRDFFRGLLEI